MGETRQLQVRMPCIFRRSLLLTHACCHPPALGWCAVHARLLHTL